MQTLIHKTALVINAGDTIGKVVAERLGALGAKVILHHENTGCEINQTLSTIKAMGGKPAEIRFDLKSSVEVQEFFSSLIIPHQVIDIMVINWSMANLSTESWNAGRKDLLQLFSSASGLVNERGHIIFISPIIRAVMQAGSAGEFPAKLSNAIRSHCNAIGEKEAVFNTIIPYGFKKEVLQLNQETEQYHAHFSAHNTLLKRFTELDDLANLTEFLASDLSAVISGQYFFTNL